MERAVRLCAAFAAEQQGVVARRQLLDAGVSRHVIDRLVKFGFLHPLHRGVYAVGHTALPQYAREQAALLACGAGAVLSGRSALYLWGLLIGGPPDVEVTVPGRHCRKREGIHLHLVDALPADDTRRRHGLALTFPARALIEYAAGASPDQLGDAVAQARTQKLVREGELEAAVKRAGTLRGAAQMRAFLRDEGGPAITRSRAERRFRKLVREAGLPAPKVNARVGRMEVDFLWEGERVLVEVDGYRFHGHRGAFEEDRRRDQILSDAGYHVIRVTWRQFTEEALALIAHIARMLDRRSRIPH